MSAGSCSAGPGREGYALSGNYSSLAKAAWGRRMQACVCVRHARGCAFMCARPLHIRALAVLEISGRFIHGGMRALGSLCRSRVPGNIKTFISLRAAFTCSSGILSKPKPCTQVPIAASAAGRQTLSTPSDTRRASRASMSTRQWPSRRRSRWVAMKGSSARYRPKTRTTAAHTGWSRSFRRNV